MASGSFDNTVKVSSSSCFPFPAPTFIPQVWSSRMVEEEDQPEGGSDAKRSKSGSQKAVTRTPVSTLGGHKEAVAGVAWLGDEGELASCSWDHTIKVWDTEMGGLKTELVGNKAFFSISYSQTHRSAPAF